MALLRTILFQSELLTVRHVACRPVSMEPGAVEEADMDAVVLPLRGSFLQHFSPRDRVLAEPSQAMLFAAGRPFRISHHGTGGDDCLVIEPAPSAWQEVGSATVPDDGLRSRSLRPHSPLTPAAMAARHLLWRRLDRGLAEALEVEEGGFALLRSVLRAARKEERRQTPRAETRSRRQLQVEAAKLALSTRPEERWTLSALARTACSAPFHLAHIFREEAGVSIHQYRQRARLARAIDVLVETDQDLTTIALDLGFSSHSHFTAVFRQSVGLTPTEFRRRASSREVAEIRKLLIAPSVATT
jgi:AraC-like DNA-binding protein